MAEPPEGSPEDSASEEVAASASRIVSPGSVRVAKYGHPGSTPNGNTQGPQQGMALLPYCRETVR